VKTDCIGGVGGGAIYEGMDCCCDIDDSAVPALQMQIEQDNSVHDSGANQPCPFTSPSIFEPIRRIRPGAQAPPRRFFRATWRGMAIRILLLDKQNNG
jgi:hypothetical protein